jgi:hypothetical protein
MGYCYEGRKLCCDICGVAGAKKYRCPFGYCPATAACSNCRKKHTKTFGKAYHREHGCEKGHNEFVARERQQAELLQAGHYLRCSALSTGPQTVHVLFQNASGHTQGFYMPNSVYRAIPLLTSATPDDYAKHGTISPAPDTYSNGTISKQVSIPPS